MEHLNNVVRAVAEDPSRAWAIAKTAGELSKRLFTFGKSLKDREEKHQVDEMLETLRDLKQSAADLEDENRDLKDKLRFKGDEYEFRTPFHHHKSKPNEPLCAKCFANNKEGRMGEPGVGVNKRYRQCLVCGNNVQVAELVVRSAPPMRSDYPMGH